MSVARYLFRLFFFLSAVALLCFLIWQPLLTVVTNSLFLNCTILGALAFGVIWVFREIFSLRTDLRHLEFLQRAAASQTPPPHSLLDRYFVAPRFTKPVAAFFEKTHYTESPSQFESRVILDSIRIRMEETHEILRYIISLLIFLGLLGTFWGLLETINSIGSLLSQITNSPTAATDIADLSRVFQEPLTGMGIAFSSSLLGLASSLVLGFCALQQSQAHNAFLNQIEDWLVNLTQDESFPPSISLLDKNLDSTTPVPPKEGYFKSARSRKASQPDFLQELLKHNQQLSYQNQQLQMSLTKLLDQRSPASFNDEPRD